MFRLPDAWVWDFWFADDGENYHLFFLRASRALGDPRRRHFRAYVGHAISPDLTTWTQVADAFVPADPPAFDDLAIWTGSITHGPGGLWYFHYSACARAEHGLIERIGVATSPDLHTWERQTTAPLEADGRWYELLGQSTWSDQAWRDPWVLADPAGDGWHMLITARAAHGRTDDRGVIGHARSADLLTWDVQPPLSKPGSGYGQLEVPQAEVVDGRPVLLFSCLGPELAASQAGRPGGVWSVPGESLTGPWDISQARPVTGENLYSGRLVRDRSGHWQLLAFLNSGPDGQFVGEISDPLPVTLTDTGHLTLTPAATPSGAS